ATRPAARVGALSRGPRQSSRRGSGQRARQRGRTGHWPRRDELQHTAHRAAQLAAAFRTRQRPTTHESSAHTAARTLTDEGAPVQDEARHAMTYKVLVDDNAHYMDESAQYTLGEYATATEALAAARALVERDLKELY